LFNVAQINNNNNNNNIKSQPLRATYITNIAAGFRVRGYVGILRTLLEFKRYRCLQL